MNVCVCREGRQDARVKLRFGFVLAHPRVPSPQRVSVLALVLHSFLTGVSLLLPSHIIRCSSDQSDTLLSTDVAEVI
jgi:hypothetical protein